ncbi:MAG: hypothetical protein ACTH0C_02445, partial [Actinomycetaceae bacterium]
PTSDDDIHPAPPRAFAGAADRSGAAAGPARLRRWGAVVALAALAPICAEFLVAYLDITGNLAESLFAVVFFMPLYGGAAILIREVALRAGLRWQGRALLAAAFGLSMTAIIDLSLWTPTNPDIEFWADLQSTTRIPGLDLSAYALVTWVLGHVVMSVLVPQTVVASTARSLRGRPWLGSIGLVLWSAGFLTVAVAIHLGERDANDVEAGPVRLAVSALAVLAVVALAFTRVGRRPGGASDVGASDVGASAARSTDAGVSDAGPAAVGASPLAPYALSPERTGALTPPRPILLIALGAIGMALVDLAPFTWWAVAGIVVLAGVVSFAVGRWTRSATWSPAHAAAFAWGALMGRTLLGFASPVPLGVSVAAKVAHSGVLTVLVLSLGVLMWRGVRRTGHAGIGSSHTS